MNSEYSEHFEHEVPPTDAAGWLDPEPFTVQTDLPEFPVSALPWPFADMAREISSVVQIAVDAPALLMLAVLCVGGGARFKVRVGRTHTEPMAFWAVVALPSGERKSQTLNHCLAPVQKWEAEEMRKHGPTIAAAHETQRLIDKRIERLRRDAVNGEGLDPIAYQREIEKLERSRQHVPPAPSVLVQDITPEALVRRMAAQRGRALLANDEGGPFQIMAGQYSKTGANLDPYLKAHAGTPIDSERVTRGCEKILHPALSMALIVQPFTVQSVVANDELRHRGLNARFQYSLPKSRVGFRAYANRAVAAHVESAYANSVMHILGSSATIPMSPQFIDIEGKCLEVWRSAHDEFEVALRDDGSLANLRDWGSKAPGTVARLTGAFHLLRCGHDDPTAIAVDPEDCERAVEIVRYLAVHAGAMLGTTAISDKEKKARRVLAWVLRHGMTSFEQRDVQQACRPWLEAKEVDNVIEVLEQRNYVRRLAEQKTSGPGRRPGGKWVVNPKVLKAADSGAQNAQNTQNAGPTPESAAPEPPPYDPEENF